MIHMLVPEEDHYLLAVVRPDGAIVKVAIPASDWPENDPEELLGLIEDGFDEHDELIASRT